MTLRWDFSAGRMLRIDDRPISPRAEVTVNADAMVTALAALSRVATGDFAIDEMLQKLCAIAADTLTVEGAGVMVLEEGRTRFVHADGPEVGSLERLQEVLQAGPCADASASLAPVVVADVERYARSAPYVALAVEVGLGAVVALPLVSRGRCWGVLDLYRCSPGAWEADLLEAAQVMADVAVSYLVMAADRDVARAAQQEMAHRTMHDDLTGLPNRALLFDRLDHALVSSGRRGTAVAVLFIDVDRFKSINDDINHAAGDTVLVEVARRLQSVLRDTDTVARYAGDEFVLICEDLPAAADEARTRVDALITRIHAGFATPVNIGALGLLVSVSIGAAIATDQPSAQELLGDADTAMYDVKQRGRGQVVVHDEAARRAIGHSRDLERDLSGALDRGELAVFYQPILATGTGRICAVEALLRWHHPTRSTLPAAAFIGAAVRSGLINQIGRWVMASTCAQMLAWRSELGDRAPTTAYVNISSRELADPTLPDALAAVVAEHGLQPEQLGLEIVEDSFSDPGLIRRVTVLHDRGHPLSIDDFGTGYSSLSRLLDLPVDLAKVDQSFLPGVPDDQRRSGLVEAVLVLANSLGLTVVAEGVESREQLSYLVGAGCQLLQGNYIGPPQPAAELSRMLADDGPAAAPAPDGGGGRTASGAAMGQH